MKKQFAQKKLLTGSMGYIIEDIRDELIEAMEKFPDFPCDPIHAVSIMSEESGEAIQAAIQWMYEKGNRRKTREELIQTAAMCIRAISGIDTGDIIAN